MLYLLEVSDFPQTPTAEITDGRLDKQTKGFPGRGKWYNWHSEGFILFTYFIFIYFVADTLGCLPNNYPTLPAAHPSLRTELSYC